MHLPLHFQEKGREFGLENYRLKTTLSRLFVCSLVVFVFSTLQMTQRKGSGKQAERGNQGEAEAEAEGVLQVLATRKRSEDSHHS